MPTLTAGQTGTFTLDAFGYIDVVANGDGTLNATSRAPNLKSNVAISRLASVRYGPYGVPMDFTIACTNGTITYTTTAGYGGSNSGGDGSGSGGGDDVTDWGSFVDGKPGTVTVNGLTWTIGYTGDNPTSYTVALTGADDLVVTVTYDNGYAEYAGNINVGGAIRMTAAQARYLASEKLAGLGALANGLRARVTDLASVTDSAGSTTSVPCVLEWQVDQWVPVGSFKIETFQTASHAALSNSGTMRSLTLPGWVFGKRNRVYAGSTLRSTIAGSAATVTQIIKLNTTIIGSATGGSGGSPSASGEIWLEGLNSASVQRSPATAAVSSGGHIVTSAAGVTWAIDGSTTDFAYTFEVTIGGTTAPTVTLEHAWLRMEAA